MYTSWCCDGRNPCRNPSRTHIFCMQEITKLSAELASAQNQLVAIDASMQQLQQLMAQLQEQKAQMQAGHEVKMREVGTLPSSISLHPGYISCWLC